jgi:formylglycine-generating enzyme required for sulfatase activity
MMRNIKDVIKALDKALDELRQLQEEEFPEMLPIPGMNISVAETPTTFGQWETFCNETNREMPQFPLEEKPQNWREYPVVYVSWEDAQDYVSWLSKKTGDKYRLPKGKEFKTFCGDHIIGNEDIAVYMQSDIQPTKTKQPNKFGLYDTLGLVWEWQEDICYGTGNIQRFLRGGSWMGDHVYTNVSYPHWDIQHRRGSVVGFRVVKENR